MAEHRMNIGMQARAEQQLLLQPKLLQSIEVLQIPAQDLEAWLQTAAESNEALLVEAAPPEAGATAINWEAAERHAQMMQNQAGRGPGLAETLESQLLLLELDPEAEAWVRFLICCLDENGYLSPSDEELLILAVDFELPQDPLALGLAIGQLQHLEPCGIGGRDMTEALLLQLDEASADYPALCRLLEEFLDDLASNRLPLVARALGIELDELGELLQQLRFLEPRPGAELVALETPVIRPDVLVEKDDRGQWQVNLARGCLPSVAVDPEMTQIARLKQRDCEAKRWAQERVERARWIVDAVQQRGETLLRLAGEVFQRQVLFLEQGPGNLRPLSMTELAEHLGVHLSTVSRTVSGKYVQCPWGILPLRYFFQVATGSGEAPAREDLAQIVRAVFDGEDPQVPLSDDEVAEELGRRGHTLARRTVAKFRRQLGIPSSYKRRKYTS